MKIKIALEATLVSLVIIVSLFYYHSHQPQILAGEGFGWDGIAYKSIYDHFKTGSPATAGFPFCNRIGTPFLASLFIGDNAATAFRNINLAFSIIFSLTIYITSMELGFSLSTRFFSLFLSIALFFSPIRFSFYYPAYTDPVFLGLLALSMLAFVKQRYAAALVITVFSYPFRESALYVLIFLSIATVYMKRPGPSRNDSIFIASCLLAIACIKISISSIFVCSGSQLKTAILNMVELLINPVRFINCSAAILMTAAPLWFFKSKDLQSKLDFVYISGFAFALTLGVLGGSDTTRIFYSFFPLYFPSIIKTISRKGLVFMIICGLGYMITNRVGRRILEPENYHPNNDEVGLFWQFPDHARPEVGLTIIATWTVLFSIYRKYKEMTDR